MSQLPFPIQGGDQLERLFPSGSFATRIRNEPLEGSSSVADTCSGRVSGNSRSPKRCGSFCSVATYRLTDPLLAGHTEARVAKNGGQIRSSETMASL